MSEFEFEFGFGFSDFGSRFLEEAGILRLMDDLGGALSSGDVLMLGGGNPARIPEVEALLRRRMMHMASGSGEFEELIGCYDAPQGNRRFIEAMAELLSERYHWRLGPENIALTNGSQTAFFYLFNLFAGSFGESSKRVLLPLAPEYMGYSDAGLTPNFFRSNRPEIELIGDDLFKYHVDFDAVSVTEDIGAICVSRPTNPTSNVLSKGELERLSELARAHNVPFIIDNAYGPPFPNIVFVDAEPIWDEHIVLGMSLSKLGLPGARTGIVVARPEVTKAISSMNAILSLAPGSFGAALTRDMVRTGEVLDISRDLIRPFYAEKSRAALGWLREALEGVSYRVHKPEGTFFFWIWFEGLPISCAELYARLKRRGVLIVPGHFFFPGLEGEWRHRHECIRLNFSQSDETVRRGVQILGDEVRAAFAAN